MSRPLTVVLTTVLLVCCEPTLHFDDVFDRKDINERPPLSAMMRAPIIMVGRVVSVSQIGGVRSSNAAPEIKVELVYVTVRVENVLKGRLSQRQIGYYYFQYSAWTRVNIGVFMYRPEQGDHRIFFLREEAGVLRCVKDVTDYTLRLYTGSHAASPPSSSLPLGEKIGHILLTPGRGTREDVFARYLDDAFVTVSVITSRSVALALLDPLLNSDSDAVRKSARSIVQAIR